MPPPERAGVRPAGPLVLSIHPPVVHFHDGHGATHRPRRGGLQRFVERHDALADLGPSGITSSGPCRGPLAAALRLTAGAYSCVTILRQFYDMRGETPRFGYPRPFASDGVARSRKAKVEPAPSVLEISSRAR